MHPLRTIRPLGRTVPRMGRGAIAGGRDRGPLVAGICDPVADAGDGLDGRGVAEFAAEPADGDLDGFGERVGVDVPGLCQEVFGAEGAPAAVSPAPLRSPLRRAVLW
jgi:hypothetical protein